MGAENQDAPLGDPRNVIFEYHALSPEVGDYVTIVHEFVPYIYGWTVKLQRMLHYIARAPDTRAHSVRLCENQLRRRSLACSLHSLYVAFLANAVFNDGIEPFA